MSNKHKTNQEIVLEIMNHSSRGALVEAFIIEAIGQYAEKFADQDPSAFKKDSWIDPEAWITVANEVKAKMEEYYGKRKDRG